MTCGIAFKCTDGVLLASDTLVSVGEMKMHMTEIKGFGWRGCNLLYAGPLHYIQQLQTKESTHFLYGEVESFQQLLWDHPLPESERDEVEFLLVNQDNELFIVDGWGSSVRCGRYGVVGSEFGWVALHMLDKRERTMSATKPHIARALRAVTKQDRTVEEPFIYKELPHVF